MENMQFSIAIKAPVEKVFETMFSEQGYREWTSVFNPSSTFEGTWAEGEQISFIGISKEGKKEGMIGIVKAYELNKYVSVKYIGLLDGDKQITEGKEVESWVGSHENYSFTTNGDHTSVTVDLDVDEPFLGYFKETYPKALDKLKEISEV